MALTVNQRERLSKALIDAFPTYTSLAKLLSFKLDMNLERISRAESLDHVVFRLISWAEEDGARLKDLLLGAVESIPKDPELRSLAEDILRQAKGTDEDVFIQPAVEEEQHLTTGELLFRGHPLLGRIFTMRPALLAGAVFVTALVLLVGASLALDVFSVPCPDGRNFGIVDKPNWLYVYPGLLPILFWWASLTNIHLCQGLHRVYWRFKVIRIRHSARPKHYLQALSEHLESRRWRPLGLALVVAVMFMVLDTYDLWQGFVRPPFPNSVKPDWDTAFTEFKKPFYLDETFFKEAPCTPTAYPSYWENLTFDIIAYAFQGAAIFLGFFWAFKFLHTLYSLSTLLKRSKTEYYLDLKEFDPDKRLGLGPLGKAYNVFLIVTVAYQIFAFLHRLQIIAQWKSESSAWKYVSVVTGGLFDPALWSNPAFYGFIGLGDWGAFLALVAMSAPVVIICYLPLWKLRKRVKEIKEEREDKYNDLHETAMRRGDKEEAEYYLRMMTALKGASVWPNGSVTAYWFLMSMIVLLIAGWFPPLLAPLLLVGVAVVLLLTFYHKRN